MLGTVGGREGRMYCPNNWHQHYDTLSFPISHLQCGVIAASEDDFVVDINTLHTFIVQFLFPYFGQSVEVPDLERRFIPALLALFFY